ncbi:O-antigen ligase family protein [Rathayibacter tanaceti]|uniref:O-antigen ligase-related domain-containing protein n=2 Tax=Rathayibacter tanaceti TaxID=1671680 RepID=A0A166HT25_9MICO|nr:O-antigen ligase family protein [Rathayibacter tanaceti]KZX21123.1 hypothetical protein ACH61_01741 [Rathayibacter tanaceti]QHC55848.1 hypothetical protein GSU10_09545 [Rathayibacter tanaceti]TCO39326.1 hypothetical protein EV639_101271 [Rathayibacter tanaceti]
MNGARHTMEHRQRPGAGRTTTTAQRGRPVSSGQALGGRLGRLATGPDAVSAAVLEKRDDKRRRIHFAIVLLVTFIMTSGGKIVDLFLAGRAASDGYSTGAVNPSNLGATVDAVAPALFLVGVAVIFFLNLGRKRANLIGLAGAAVYLVTAQVTNTLAVGGVNPTPKYWVIIALVLALWSIAPRWDDLRVIGIAIVLIGLASLLTGLTDQGWMREDALLAGETKALIGTRLLAGIFPQMNVLGMTMALGLPFVLLLRRRAARYAGLAIVLANLVLSASRTSLIAAGITILVAVVLRLIRHERTRRAVAISAVTLTATAMVLLPILVNDRSALTSRGAIWMSSMSVIPDHFLVGLSTNAFTKEGIMPRLIGHTPWHGHNLFVSTMVWGGIILIAALLVFLVSVLVRSLTYFDRSMVSYLFVLTLLACSLAEMPLRIDDFDGVSWLTWVAVLAVMMVPGPPAPAEQVWRRRPVLTEDASSTSGPRAFSARGAR